MTSIIKEIFTYTPHLLVILAPLRISNGTAFYTSIIMIFMNCGIEAFVAYQQEREKAQAQNLFDSILELYELEKKMERGSVILGRHFDSSEEVKSLDSCDPKLRTYLCKQALDFLKGLTYLPHLKI
jgi:hypothetical protein